MKNLELQIKSSDAEKIESAIHVSYVFSKISAAKNKL